MPQAISILDRHLYLTELMVMKYETDGRLKCNMPTRASPSLVIGRGLDCMPWSLTVRDYGSNLLPTKPVSNNSAPSRRKLLVRN